MNDRKNKVTARFEAWPVGVEAEATPEGYVVVTLRLNLSQISDENFALIRAFPKLRRLELLETWGITPRGLVHLEATPALEELNLCCSTAAEDEGMIYVGQLTALRFLDLNANAITDAGLEKLAGLTKLECLLLGYNRVTDGGLRFLRDMTHLRELSLNSTAVTDAGLNDLLALSELEHLSLYHTTVSDEGIALLNRLPKLNFLNLYYSRVSGQGLAQIRPGVVFHSEFGSTWRGRCNGV